MKTADVQRLPYGLYLIYWKSGGCSEASVGGTDNGDRWLAPTNWVGGLGASGDIWRKVERVERVPTAESLAHEIRRQAVYADAGEPAPPCDHHWHSTGIMLPVMPPIFPQVCCVCGARRNYRPTPDAAGCGPYAPREEPSMHELVQQELNRRYLAARVAWTMHPGVQEAARVLGMSHRAYCDAYVAAHFPPPGALWAEWTSATNDGWQPDVEAAYRWEPPQKGDEQ